MSSNPAHPLGCGNVEVVDVDEVDVVVPGIVPGSLPAPGTVVDVGVLVRTLVVVLASARAPVTSDGSGGTAARAGVHDAQHTIPTATTARRRGLTASMMTCDTSIHTSYGDHT